MTSSVGHKNESRRPKYDREAGIVASKELVAKPKVLSKNDEELAGAIAAGTAVVR